MTVALRRLNGILEREVRRVFGNRSSRSGTAAAQTVWARRASFCACSAASV